ncbi:MAG TPA: PASTA domain-containing protein [Terriglobales bacterium]|jgi:beta-lactam-binding protein with PASTA domain|nr:PASTA domain-containing protein [Terriglobales bacterium]
MRQFFRMLFLALVLMTVSLISALTAMQLAIHGREVAVPKLIGMSPAEAERASAASGLQVVVERQFYSADVPEGKIVTQMPASGTKVRRGWSVRVAQSLGPLRVAIPNVTGGSERVAELNIQRRGLSLDWVAHISLPDEPPDQVISQSPPPNASGVSAPKISLLVSDGAEPLAFVMPDLTGQPLGSATLALRDAGFSVGKVSLLPAAVAPGEAQPVAAGPSATSEPSAASMIVSQSPTPGQKLPAGSAVSFEVR